MTTGLSLQCCNQARSPESIGSRDAPGMFRPTKTSSDPPKSDALGVRLTQVHHHQGGTAAASWRDPAARRVAGRGCGISRPERAVCSGRLAREARRYVQLDLFGVEIEPPSK
jgi:hypothetical protein